LFLSLDLFRRPAERRIRNDLQACYGKLTTLPGKYRVAVIDMRHEGIDETGAYYFIKKLLRLNRYEKLSAVILLTFDVTGERSEAGVQFILIENPHAIHKITASELFRHPKSAQLLEKLYLFELLSRIRFPSIDWQHWFEMQQHLNLFHRETEYGSLSPPV
jgi:hypothetical protein